MRFLGLSLAVVASAAWTVLADDELKIDVTHKVDCERKTKDGDNIAVHYTGTLTDGTKFDSSFDRNQPISFVLGTGRVIKGWDQGLLDMCIGEKRSLTIPPSFGYGNRATGPIPAGSTLLFDTELVSIEGVNQPEPASSASESVSSGASSVASSLADAATEGIKEKIMSKVGEAAEAIKVTVQDTDGDGQEHNEL